MIASTTFFIRCLMTDISLTASAFAICAAGCIRNGLLPACAFHWRLVLNFISCFFFWLHIITT
jgi:hypothetical protein